MFVIAQELVEDGADSSGRVRLPGLPRLGAGQDLGASQPTACAAHGGRLTPAGRKRVDPPVVHGAPNDRDRIGEAALYVTEVVDGPAEDDARPLVLRVPLPRQLVHVDRREAVVAADNPDQ